MLIHSHKNTVFICHASDDKEAIVRELAEHLRSLNLNVFYDEFSLSTGDDINKKIHEGLKKTKFGVLILSPHFFLVEKEHTWIEMGALNFLQNEGEALILPYCYDMTPKAASDKTKSLGYLVVTPIYKQNIQIIANQIFEKVKDDSILTEKKLKEIKKAKRKSQALTLSILLSVVFLIVLLYAVAIYKPLNFKKPEPIAEVKSPAITPFDTSGGSFNILLLPFNPVDKDIPHAGIENVICDRLKRMNELENLNLQVKFDSLSHIKLYKDATNRGKQLFASMVIWGDLYEFRHSDSKEACLRFVNIRTDDIPPTLESRETSIEKMESLSEVAEGKLQKDVDYIVYWIAASQALFKKDYTKALKHLRKIEKSESANFELFYYEAECFTYLNQTDSAKLKLEKVFTMYSDYARARFLYALLLDNNKRKPYLESYLNTHPNNYLLYAMYGLYLNFISEPLNAKKQLKKALTLKPNNDANCYNYAMILSDKLGENDTAKVYFEKALSTDFNNFLYQFNYGVFLIKTLDSSNAIIHLKHALRINPNSGAANYEYAHLISVQKDKKDETIEHYKKAISASNPRDFWESDFATFLIEKDGDFNEVRKHYNRALLINPLNGMTYMCYAVFLAYTVHDTTSARRLFETAILLSPKDARINCYYAIFLNNMGEYKKAKKYFETSLRYNPKSALTHINYSFTLYYHLNDRKNAKKHYIEAGNLDHLYKGEFGDSLFRLRN